jgi:hypothetical protein
MSTGTLSLKRAYFVWRREWEPKTEARSVRRDFKFRASSPSRNSVLRVCSSLVFSLVLGSWLVPLDESGAFGFDTNSPRQIRTELAMENGEWRWFLGVPVKTNRKGARLKARLSPTSRRFRNRL